MKGISNNDMVGTAEVTPENHPDGLDEESITAASEFEVRRCNFLIIFCPL